MKIPWDVIFIAPENEEILTLLKNKLKKVNEETASAFPANMVERKIV